MKHNILKLLMAFAMLLLGTQAQALIITPEDCDSYPADSVGTIECTVGFNTNTSEIVSFIESMYGVTELYKSNVRDKDDVGYGTDSSGIDEKAFADSYDTEFTNTLTDPGDVWMSYVGGDSIDCLALDCYLLVKDGAHNPAWYLFNIGSWDGMEDIHLEGFWPDNGAISHIAIFGGDYNIPEPGILALLGLGLVAMVVTRRKVK